MTSKPVNHYKLFSFFLEWAKQNNWIVEEQGEFLLTPEGEEELSALGLDIENVLNGVEKKTDSENLKQTIDQTLSNNKTEIKKIHLYTDGGSRGNQFKEGGKAAIGIVLCDEYDEEITMQKQYLGRATNNQAEYTALITGLSLAKNYNPQEITCFSDSQLMINQLNGTYKIRDKKLQKFVMEVKELEKSFQLVTYIHVKRENRIIKKADKLVNKVLDAQGV